MEGLGVDKRACVALFLLSVIWRSIKKVWWMMFGTRVEGCWSPCVTRSFNGCETEEVERFPTHNPKQKSNSQCRGLRFYWKRLRLEVSWWCSCIGCWINFFGRLSIWDPYVPTKVVFVCVLGGALGKSVSVRFVHCQIYGMLGSSF